MAANGHFKETDRNAFLTALNASIGTSGRLRVYDGTQPATVATALSGQNILGDLALSATAFGAPVAGVLTANAITSANCVGTGTGTWGTLTTSAGVRIVDFSVGTSGTDMVITGGTFVASPPEVFSCSSFVITLPA